MRYAKKVLATRRPGATVSVVIVTDGFSYDLIKEPSESLRAEKDVNVYAVGLADSINM